MARKSADNTNEPKAHDIEPGDELLLRVKVPDVFPGRSQPIVIELEGKRLTTIRADSPAIEKVIKQR